MKTLACGCTTTVHALGEERIHEACPAHFEYGSRMVEAALSGVRAATAFPDRPRAVVSETADRLPDPPITPEPLEFYPIKLHSRTLHALVTAMLAGAGRLPNEQGALESYLERLAINASAIIGASRAEVRERD
jgi:hypothetical protein